MDNVFFRPWVGKQYGSENSIFQRKVLVIGDSHYCEDYCSSCGDNEKIGLCSGFTVETVNYYLNPNISARWKGTFTTFMNSFVACTKHEEQSRFNIWSSVAFYNYLQVAAGSDARQTQNYDYRESNHQSALLEVIGELEPDVIISWGNKVWDAFPSDLGYGKYRLSSKFGNCCCIYPYKEREILLIGVTHPSTAYRSLYWSGVFTESGANQ